VLKYLFYNILVLDDTDDPPVSDRIAGIKTWVSLEPVIDPEQAIELIRLLHPYVGHWKAGKIN